MIYIPFWWWLAPIGAIAALAAAYMFYRQLLAASPGDERMREIAGYVREGAFAYLKRQYVVVALAFLFLVLLLAIQSFVLKQQHGLVPFAFLTGGFFSGLSGFIGMNTATLASNRTTQGAKESLNRGLQVAFRAGAVMGLVVVGLGLLDISLWFYLLARILPATIDGFRMSLEQITVVMLTFGMGASTQALFARVGGGIFTKAADVGADLVGKVEAGIPEDDPRNPAVIADNVGDNVGDVAGMGADLYESYCGSILATAALGAAAALGLAGATGEDLAEAQSRLVVAPMILAGIGILLSIAGIYLVKTEEGASQMNLLWALRRGIYGSSAFIVVAALAVCWLVLPASVWFGVFLAITVGLIVGVLIGYFTEYYTAAEFSPTKWIADQSATGPATTIIAGVAQGMLSTWAAISIVGVGTIVAYFVAGGAENAALGLYGVGFAAVGMLATLGVTLATDAYGPIADNAGGNAEMTHQPPEVRQRTDALDSLGNTTAATGKGFAIGSAALTALALLAAFVEEVRIGIQREGQTFVEERAAGLEEGGIYPLGFNKFVQVTAEPDEETGFPPTFIAASRGNPYVESEGGLIRATDAQIVEHYRPEIEAAAPIINLVRVREATLADFMGYYDVNLMNPKLLVGVFFGVLMVFVFCGLTMKAVGRAAGRMVEEVRRQFRELNLLTDPDAKADYARCVSIATAGAQKEMIVPAFLAVGAPLVTGLVLDVSGLMGLLAGALTSGFAVAIFMANSGGAWDNAKKYIEAGAMGGKGSEAHKAAVVGDTVGDPFKDTSGPSLNILIKLMSMVAVVFAGVIVKYGPEIGAFLGINNY
ncbi:sodium-translocating pyrophosphatase [Tautonia plasticadhaerens]|uniref:Putative K(+)-stimulated pyrophosphate-energized sodium pump n=1 Tax=Tautonia plasticadhaerens TaxID=2527974 RepID=A0A518H3S3_9BACT|nr:sodium-translocating pyrophosphatase [Tautonia plasticadhaerens]QDV35462.1 Putative K(+)-stimulated pyrophosphate-energized sodium pump [Tautonia plasticadhaerens]